MNASSYAREQPKPAVLDSQELPFPQLLPDDVLDRLLGLQRHVHWGQRPRVGPLSPFAGGLPSLPAELL